LANHPFLLSTLSPGSPGFKSRFLKFVRNFRDGLYYSVINVRSLSELSQGVLPPLPPGFLSARLSDSLHIISRSLLFVNNFFYFFKNCFFNQFLTRDFCASLEVPHIYITSFCSRPVEISFFYKKLST